MEIIKASSVRQILEDYYGDEEKTQCHDSKDYSEDGWVHRFDINGQIWCFRSHSPEHAGQKEKLFYWKETVSVEKS